MPEIKIYNTTGEEIGKEKLPEDLFGLATNVSLMHQVVLALQANARGTYAHTLTRGDVRGGGKKPWRQKGTGQARQGSRRSPIWVGGGITFGPRKERNYTQKLNKKMKRNAFLMSLSDKVCDEKWILLDSWNISEERMKTKDMTTVLSHLPVKPTAKTLCIIGDNERAVLRAGKNLSMTLVTPYQSLGVLDILKAEYILCSKEALEGLKSLHETKKKKI